MKVGVLGDFHSIPATKPNSFSVVAGDIVDIDDQSAVKYIGLGMAETQLTGDVGKAWKKPAPKEMAALRAKIEPPQPGLLDQLSELKLKKASQQEREELMRRAINM